MPLLPTFILPKNILAALRTSANHIKSSSLLAEIAKSDPEQVFQRLNTTETGLSEAEAGRRAAQHGLNVVTQEEQHRRLRMLGRACVNPLVVLLLLATVSAISEFYQETNDYRAATVMLFMVFLGVALRFIQESRADDAAAKLKAMISVTATVVRDGQARELPLGELVPGDVVRLSAGDMIPADLRIVSSKDMFVIQSSLTGESLPVEKFDTKEGDANPILELKNTCFLGTSVESGTAPE
jgi:P-type Mg2+ transporter